MNLFATPCPGMVYDNEDDPDGTPVTIIGVSADGSQVLVVDGDGVMTFVNNRYVVFVGLAPTHTSVTEAMGMSS